MKLSYIDFEGVKHDVHKCIDVKVDGKGLHYRTDDNRRWVHILKSWNFEVKDYEI